jgi:hypothetical protein
MGTFWGAECSATFHWQMAFTEDRHQWPVLLTSPRLKVETFRILLAYPLGRGSASEDLHLLSQVRSYLATGAVHNTASPENLRDWPIDSLAKERATQSVAATSFRFSVAALLSPVPGRTISTK